MTPGRGQGAGLSRFRRGLLALAAIILVLLTVFSDGGRRDAAVRFIEEDLRPPVSRVQPFRVYDEFTASLFSCGRQQPVQCEGGTLHTLLRLPGALLHVVHYTASQGVPGVIVVGLPLLAFGAFALKSLLEGELGFLHPLAWLLVILAAAVTAWLAQLAVLITLFVVKQTVLACGVLALLYAVYERIDLWNKLRLWLATFTGQGAQGGGSAGA